MSLNFFLNSNLIILSVQHKFLFVFSANIQFDYKVAANIAKDTKIRQLKYKQTGVIILDEDSQSK